MRDLTDTEVKAARQWARENYVPGSAINPHWPPIIRIECELINARRALELIAEKSRQQGAEMDGTGPRYEDARPPTGDDWNELHAYIEVALALGKHA